MVIRGVCPEGMATRSATASVERPQDNQRVAGVLATLGGAAGPMLSLLEAVPCPVAVVDDEQRLRSANDAFRRMVGIDGEQTLPACLGDALGCVNARAPGHHVRTAAGECAPCELRELGTRSLAGCGPVRALETLEVEHERGLRRITVEITATPVTAATENLVVMVVDRLDVETERRSRNVDNDYGIVGHHPRMIELLRAIEEVGPSDLPVIIQGETGTGKELVAKALHRVSLRSRGGPMIAVNCGAIPDTLLESELFGHVKGAFTGAERDRRGRFELADGGTIFLDEIGELSPSLQVKLLRVLQEGAFERVGGERTISVDARLVCATNRDLYGEVVKGRFRSDLFYRLFVIPITVPPLRERGSDIALLAEHFLRQQRRERGRQEAALSPEALAVLQRHLWPGNVRELQNAMTYGMMRAGGGMIGVQHLPETVLDGRRDTGRASLRRRNRLSREVVLDALWACSGNRTRAAELLGVSRSTLYRFLRSVPDLEALLQ